jgi:Ca2+-binding EF-hand superfamily protein
VRGNETLYELFQLNTPVHENRRSKRLSIMEQIGLEVTVSKTSSIIEGKRTTIRHKTESKKAAYKKVEETDEILKEIAEIFRRRANYKGKMLVREFYEALSTNSVLAARSAGLISDLKFRLSNEVHFDEVRAGLMKRRSQRANTEVLSETLMPSKEVEPSPISSNKMNVLKAMFDKFDVNGDGVITLPELKKGLHNRFSVQTIEEMFREYDEDSNGVLDFNEFVKLFTPDGAILPGL